MSWKTKVNRVHKRIKLNTNYVGRRGAFLILFSIAFIVIGYGIITVPVITNRPRFPHEYLDPYIRLFVWVVPGLIGGVCAFLRKPGQDIYGFVALCLPVAERAVSYATGMLLALVYPEEYALLKTGLAGFIVYMAMLGSIMIVASWPDPRIEFVRPLLKSGGK